ncbi:MAG: hypothetical protein ABSA53_16050 [Streptosporangiaceae bacterium]|jgi:hypothetical protein
MSRELERNARLDDLQARADEAVARIVEDQAQAGESDAYVSRMERQAEPEVSPEAEDLEA